MNIEVGTSYTSTLVVDESTTALHVGSGDLPVFATPSMVAIMENAAMKLVAPYLAPGETTVGTQIHVEHTKASPLGTSINATATLVEIVDRKLVFNIVATDPSGFVGKGNHTRYVVDSNRFMAKLS